MGKRTGVHEAGLPFNRFSEEEHFFFQAFVNFIDKCTNISDLQTDLNKSLG